MFKNLTIKSRLIFIIFFMAVTLLGIGSVALFGMSKAKDSLKTVYEDRIIALDQLTDIESLILQNHLAISANLATQTSNSISINTAKVEKNISEINRIWKAYMATNHTAEEKILVAKFADDRNKLVTQGLNPAVAALRANEIKKAIRIDMDAIRPLYQPVGQDIKALTKLQLTVTKQEYEEVQSRYDIIRNIIITAAIIGMGLALWIGFLLIRAISRPLEDAVRIARSVAAGDLTQQIEVHSTNEIGQLMEALKEIHGSLMKIIDQVRDSETRIRAVLDNVDEGIIAFSEGGEIKIFNPAAEQIFGYAGNEIIGQNASLLTLESDQGQHDDSLEQHQQLNKSTNPGESRGVVGVRKNGTRFPLEFKTNVIHLNMEFFVITVIRDLTARKEAENELLHAKEAEEELNHAHRDLEQLVQSRTAELEQVNLRLAEDVQNREQAESVLLRRNMELSELNTRLKEAQEQLLQNEKMASIGLLAAGVAHEINNPIGYVHSNIGALETYLNELFLILDAYASTENVLTTDAASHAELQRLKAELNLDFLRMDIPLLMTESKEGISRVRKIVQDLKDFSHVNSSQEWKWADLHQGLNLTLNVVNNEIKYKAEVVKEYGTLPEIECLPSEINQVFLNLLVNAAHAITDDERGIITLRSGCDDRCVWIEVADTGSGIAPEHMKKIFDPFFTTKPIGKGTGLGLSLSYGILQKHHGRIEVQSEVGKGTTFRLWLPIRQSGMSKHEFEESRMSSHSKNGGAHE
ncbi:MAG: Tar ligand binding domain-containing protein [Candidatus Nitrotoga sp.]